MVIPITCPGCQAAFEVPETLAGKTIRCTSCKTQLTVGAAPAAGAKKPFGWASSPTAAKPAAAPLSLDDAPAAKPAAPAKPAAAAGNGKPAAKPVKTAVALVDDDDEDDRKKTSPSKPAKNGVGIKGAPKKRRDDDDDDDDDDDRPRRKKKNAGGGGGAMIALIGGGVICLGAIVGLTVWLLNGDDKSDSAKSDSGSNSNPGNMAPPSGGSSGGPPGGPGGMRPGMGAPRGGMGAPGAPGGPGEGGGGMDEGGGMAPGGPGGGPPMGFTGGSGGGPPPGFGSGGGPPPGAGGGSGGGPPPGFGSGGGPPPGFGTGSGGGPPPGFGGGSSGGPPGGVPTLPPVRPGLGGAAPGGMAPGAPAAGGTGEPGDMGGGMAPGGFVPPAGGGSGGGPPGGFTQPPGIGQIPGAPGGFPPRGGQPGGMGMGPGGLGVPGIPGQPGGFGGGQTDPNPPPAGALTDGNRKATVDQFFAGAFDAEKKEFISFVSKPQRGFSTTQLKRHNVAQGFSEIGTYKMPHFVSRAVIDPSKELLYVATIMRPNAQTLSQLFDQAVGVGDVQIFDLKPIHEGKVKDQAELKPLHLINVGGGAIRGLELSNDGKSLYVLTTTTATKGRKSYLRIYETETRKLTGEPKVLDEPALTMRKSPDGKYLLVLEVTEQGKSSFVRVLDTTNLVQAKKLPLQGIANDVTATTGGQFVAPVGGTGGINLVLATDASTRDLELGINWKAAAKPGYVQYAPDGKTLFVSGFPPASGTYPRQGQPHSPGLDVYEVTDPDSPTGFKKKASIRTAGGYMVGGQFVMSPDGEYLVFHSGVVVDTAKVGGNNGEGAAGGFGGGVGVGGFPGGAGVPPGSGVGLPIGGAVPPGGGASPKPPGQGLNLPPGIGGGAAPPGAGAPPGNGGASPKPPGKGLNLPPSIGGGVGTPPSAPGAPAKGPGGMN